MGYAQCGNCGFDLSAGWNASVQAWGAQPYPARKSRLPIVAAIVGIGVLAAAGAFVAISRHGSESSPGQTSAASGPASTGQAGGAADSTWITFAPSGRGFTARYPGQPSLASQSIQTAVGEAPVALWTYQDGAHLGLFAGVATYPANSMTGVTQSAVYDGAVAGMASSTSLHVDSVSQSVRDGHTGRAFSMSGATYSTQGQIYMVGDNLYMVYAVYDSFLRDRTRVDAFLAGFHLTV